MNCVIRTRNFEIILRNYSRALRMKRGVHMIGIAVNKTIKNMNITAHGAIRIQTRISRFIRLISHLTCNFALAATYTHIPLRIPEWERDDGCRPRVAALEGKQEPYDSSPLPCTKDIGRYVIRCIVSRPQTSYCSSMTKYSLGLRRALSRHVSRKVSCQ